MKPIKLVILLKIILNYDEKKNTGICQSQICKNKMLSSILKMPDSIKIHVKDSEGRVLSEDIFSKINIPEENNSQLMVMH